MRISDWSSDVCSSDLVQIGRGDAGRQFRVRDRPNQIEPGRIAVIIARPMSINETRRQTELVVEQAGVEIIFADALKRQASEPVVAADFGIGIGAVARADRKSVV